MMQESIKYIRNKMTRAELYGQLAEECAELAQAALKLQRLLMPLNKPRTDAQSCYAQLEEEVEDVLLCLQVLGCSSNQAIAVYKANRWASNIAETIRED